MTTYTSNLQLSEPTPFDPSVTDSWGTILNTNDALIDAAVSSTLLLSVAGSGDVILTTTAGTPDQARNQDFVFSGALTGDITVFWPMGLTRFFSVKNATTGAFTLTLAVNNGSGAPAGATYVIAQSEYTQFKSDGTDVTVRGVSTAPASPIPSGTVMGSFLQSTAPTGWTQSNAFNDAVIRLVDNTGTGGATGGSWTIGGVTISGTSITQAQMPNVNFTVSDPSHTHSINDPSHTHTYTEQTGSGNGSGGNPFQSQFTNNTGGAFTGISINGAFTGIVVNSGGSGSTHTHTFSNDATWRPAFVNALVCTKN